MNESIYIILKQFKKEHITEEEAVKLIEDLYRFKYTSILYPQYPQITYETQQPQRFEITCKQ